MKLDILDREYNEHLAIIIILNCDRGDMFYSLDLKNKFRN